MSASIMFNKFIGMEFADGPCFVKLSWLQMLFEGTWQEQKYSGTGCQTIYQACENGSHVFPAFFFFP